MEDTTSTTTYTAEQLQALMTESWDAWARALERAKDKLVGVPTEVHDGCYQITSATLNAVHQNNVYTVHVTEDDGLIAYECDCIGFSHGWTCWHTALVSALPKEYVRRIIFHQLRKSENSLTPEELIMDPWEVLPELGSRFRKGSLIAPAV